MCIFKVLHVALNGHLSKRIVYSVFILEPVGACKSIHYRTFLVVLTMLLNKYSIKMLLTMRLNPAPNT